MRYDFLERAAETLGAARIATAHNSEDNAETVLMNLVRGSSLSGLSGIPPVRGRIVRPLLRTGRDQILLYLAGQNVPYVEDASNRETEYTRNKWRHLLFPLLRDLNPRAAEAVGRAAFLAGEDDAFLYSLAGRAVKGARPIPGGLVLKASSLETLPSPVASRAILLLAEQVSGGRGCRSALHVENALAVLRDTEAASSCQLPGGVSFRREYGRLFLLNGREGPSFSPVSLSQGEKTLLMDGLWEIGCFPSPPQDENILASPFVFRIKRDMINESLRARPRGPGDRIRLAGGNGSRSLKRLFIDAKVPHTLRGAVPVIVCGDRVVAVAGFGADRAFAALPGESALAITVKGDILDG
jgi:tRNA(Ile)-lysidine synthase